MAFWNWFVNLFKSKKVVVKPLPKVNTGDKRSDNSDKVKYTLPEFVRVKGVKTPNRGEYKTPSGKFKGLVVHYTVSGRTASSAKAVLNYLVNHKDRLICMVMDEDGKIYIPEDFDILRSRGAHAGSSRWAGDSGLNSYYAGMEICCWGLNSKTGPFRTAVKGDGYVIPGKYQTYTEAQEKALINFCLWALDSNNEFSADRICGHDEAREQAGLKGDKQDPGASLSMTMPTLRKRIKDLSE